MTSLEELPSELLIKIFSDLPTSDLLRIRQGTQRFYHVSGKTTTHNRLRYTFNGDHVNQSFDSQLKVFSSSPLTYKHLKFVFFNVRDFEAFFESQNGSLSKIKSVSFEKCLLKKETLQFFPEIEELKLVSCDIDEAIDEEEPVQLPNIKDVTLHSCHPKFYEAIYKSNLTRLESLTVKDADYFKGFSEERRTFLNFLIRNRESLRNIWWNDFFREIKGNEFFECGLYNLRNCVYDKQYQMKLGNLDSIEFSCFCHRSKLFP